MKSKIGSQNILYPMPVTIIGALVDGKVNFINIAHVGILNATAPHLITLSMNKVHYTNAGIKENKAFSVNIPTRSQMTTVDYAGLVSGKQVDKSGLFEVFYGELSAAPLVANCPLSMECRLMDVLDYESNDIFIGEVVNTYADDRVLTNGKVDLAKVDPLLFDMTSVQYWSIGESIGKCWGEGKKYQKAL